MERLHQPLEQPQIPEPGDATEALFLQIAERQGLLIKEAPMISLVRKKKNKWDKKSTVPDFLVRKNEQDVYIYVEVTENNINEGHKHGQLKVMTEAGFGSRYVQLTKAELEEIDSANGDLFEYIQQKIKD